MKSACISKHSDIHGPLDVPTVRWLSIQRNLSFLTLAIEPFLTVYVKHCMTVHIGSELAPIINPPPWAGAFKNFTQFASVLYAIDSRQFRWNQSIAFWVILFCPHTDAQTESKRRIISTVVGVIIIIAAIMAVVMMMITLMMTKIMNTSMQTSKRLAYRLERSTQYWIPTGK